jgi:hypothetical protein
VNTGPVMGSILLHAILCSSAPCFLQYVVVESIGIMKVELNILMDLLVLYLWIGKSGRDFWMFLDFDHLIPNTLKKARFRNWIYFRHHIKCWKAPILYDPLERALS